MKETNFVKQVERKIAYNIFQKVVEDLKEQGYDIDEISAMLEGYMDEENKTMLPLYKLWLTKIETKTKATDLDQILLQIHDLPTFESNVAGNLDGDREIGVSKAEVMKIIRQYIK